MPDHELGALRWFAWLGLSMLLLFVAWRFWPESIQ